MYKKALFLIILMMFSCLFGCKPLLKVLITDPETPPSQVVEAEGYHIRFYLPGDWDEEPVESWDLHYSNGDAWFNAFTYKYLDLAQDETPLDFFEELNGFIAQTRDHVQEVMDEEVELLNNEFVTSKLFSGEKDGHKNWYYCALVDFGKGKDFAVVMFTSTPSYMLRDMDMFNEILSSAESY